jgi:4-diphosphocytidyl-2-C-methyl-D-erythritol kinase
MEVSLFSPAKINLFLAVTGRRSDGYHDLVSVAAPLDFGDTLVARTGEVRPGAPFTLECDDPAVPVDESNLVLKAARAFAAATGWQQAVHFVLRKKIPIGAGLGGGSSNAVAALRALNRLAGEPLDAVGLTRLAAGLGSDCVLFLADAPVVMRGRGERVEVLSAAAAARVRGRQVLLFKPSFGVSTPWAYGRMVARGSDYLPAVEAEARLAGWLAGGSGLEELLFNNMEPAVFAKYLPLPVLLEKLSKQFSLAAVMSGSGSTCYALLPGTAGGADGADNRDLIAAMRAAIEAGWGSDIFLQPARLV